MSKYPVTVTVTVVVFIVMCRYNSLYTDGMSDIVMLCVTIISYRHVTCDYFSCRLPSKKSSERCSTVEKAANKWEIPRTIMNDMKLGLYSPHDRPGTNPILSVMEVKLLEEWILEMSRRGLPLIRNNMVTQFCSTQLSIPPG